MQILLLLLTLSDLFYSSLMLNSILWINEFLQKQNQLCSTLYQTSYACFVILLTPSFTVLRPFDSHFIKPWIWWCPFFIDIWILLPNLAQMTYSLCTLTILSTATLYIHSGEGTPILRHSREFHLIDPYFFSTFSDPLLLQKESVCLYNI